MKKLLFSSLILMGISVMVSCKKEVGSPSDETASLSSQSISSQSISSQDISNADTGTIISSTHFGVLVSGAGSTDERITVANKFGVSYVRSFTTLKSFNGKDGALEKYLNSGFKVILNLNWDDVSTVGGVKTPVPFPKDMVTYKQKLGAVLDKYKPEVAVIENEPTTKGYHSGLIEDYITEL